MEKPRIVVVGSCNMDIYSWTAHLPEPGETVIGERYLMVMGGKGANQAVATSRLGADVTLVGRVGNDLFGRQMLETLESYGVGCEFVKVDEGPGSGVALITVDKKPENVIVVIPGTNMRITPTDVMAAESRIQKADVVMMQLEIPIDIVEYTADLTRASNAMCILNPAPAQSLSERLIKKFHLLTPNQQEAKALTGIAADTLDGAKKAGRALLKMGAMNVILTLGALGALIASEDETIHVPGIHLEDSIDTSGAGDAFMGGLSIALARGKSLENATRYANIIGALSTRKRGAMPAMPTAEEAESFARSLSGYIVENG